jgi:hypothetical protein
MIERHGGAHRMTHEKHILAAEPLEHRFEVVVECPDLPGLRIVRVSVPSEIEGVDGSLLGPAHGQVVPPMRVRPAAVEQDRGRFRGCVGARIGLPEKTMELDPVSGLESK